MNARPARRTAHCEIPDLQVRCSEGPLGSTAGAAPARIPGLHASSRNSARHARRRELRTDLDGEVQAAGQERGACEKHARHRARVALQRRHALEALGGVVVLPRPDEEVLHQRGGAQEKCTWR